MPDDMIVSFILAICLIPVGLYLIGHYFPQRLFARRNWPSTNGVITFADVLDYNTKTTKYQVTSISYNYRISGEDFSAAQEIPYHHSYQIGKPTAVHYNPTRPQESYDELLLHMGMIRSARGFVLLVIGIIVIFLLGTNTMILVSVMTVIGNQLSFAQKAIGRLFQV